MCDSLRERFNNLFLDDNETVFDSELINFVNDSLTEYHTQLPRLFRYSPATYHNIRGLETETLYLSPNGEMNDIYEGLSCKISDEVLRKVEKMNDLVFLKSFCEDKNNLLMWGHYTENYSGMCVEYDFRNASDDILFHLFPVVYSDKRKSFDSLQYAIDELDDLKETNAEYCSPNETSFLKDIVPSFLIKAKCWEYEKEWRLVATYPQIYNQAEDLDDECEKFYELNNQKVSVKNCIKAVYLGPRMESEIKDHIKEICREKLREVPVYEVQLSKDKYELEFEKEN